MDGENGTGTRFAMSRREVNRALLSGACLAWLGRLPRAAPAPRPLFDFAIAGGWYYDLPRVWRDLSVGETLSIVPEFDNEFDEHALAVHRGDLKLGYVPRIANIPVAGLIRAGTRVTAQIVARLDVKRGSDAPPDLVFTSFMNGDPRIRLAAAQNPTNEGR